jgi:hypothetical protein
MEYFLPLRVIALFGQTSMQDPQDWQMVMSIL